MSMLEFASSPGVNSGPCVHSGINIFDLSQVWIEGIDSDLWYFLLETNIDLVIMVANPLGSCEINCGPASLQSFSQEPVGSYIGWIGQSSARRNVPSATSNEGRKLRAFQCPTLHSCKILVTGESGRGIFPKDSGVCDQFDQGPERWNMVHDFPVVQL